MEKVELLGGSACVEGGCRATGVTDSELGTGRVISVERRRS